MKLRLHNILRTALRACRSTTLSLAAVAGVVGITLSSHSYAVNLGGAAGEYTFSNSAEGNSYIAPSGDTIALGADTTILTGKATGEMTINVESGSYIFGIQNIAGTLLDVGNLDAPNDITLNVSGRTGIAFNGAFADNVTLYGYSGPVKSTIYTTFTLNIDTEGDIGALSLTTRGNRPEYTPTFIGNQNITIKAGEMLATGGISLALGQKAVNVTGDINYAFGEIGNYDSELTFAGNIYGGLTEADGIVDGHVNITINSGTYQSVYGAGTDDSHTGNVTINYNGGTIGGQLVGTAGASVGGTRTLNIGAGATLLSSNINYSTFDTVNLAGALSIDNDPSAALNINFTGGSLSATQFTLTGKNSTDANLSSTGSTFSGGNIQNATLSNLHLTVNDGQSLTLTNSTLSNATITAAATLSSDSLDAVEYIFTLSNITFSSVSVEGALTLNVELSGADATNFETYLTEGYVGFELEGLALSELEDSDSRIILNIVNGGTDESLYSSTILGMTEGATGGTVLYIPEPSTATLSLLALTGLLARRRRQAA